MENTQLSNELKLKADQMKNDPGVEKTKDGVYSLVSDFLASKPEIQIDQIPEQDLINYQNVVAQDWGINLQDPTVNGNMATVQINSNPSPFAEKEFLIKLLKSMKEKKAKGSKKESLDEAITKIDNILFGMKESFDRMEILDDVLKHSDEFAKTLSNEEVKLWYLYHITGKISQVYSEFEGIEEPAIDVPLSVLDNHMRDKGVNVDSLLSHLKKIDMMLYDKPHAGIDQNVAAMLPKPRPSDEQEALNTMADSGLFPESVSILESMIFDNSKDVIDRLEDMLSRMDARVELVSTENKPMFMHIQHLMQSYLQRAIVNKEKKDTVQLESFIKNFDKMEEITAEDFSNFIKNTKNNTTQMSTVGDLLFRDIKNKVYNPGLELIVGEPTDLATFNSRLANIKFNKLAWSPKDSEEIDYIINKIAGMTKGHIKI